ncbi:MAG: DNA cytosine methyltransferase [Gemmatimonadaceae bacterium]
MLPAIDLFSGAGGLSIGATLAGADVRLLVDCDRVACDTVEANLAWHPAAKVLCADVTDLTGTSLRCLAGLDSHDPLILVGGAPCQPFSKNAYWLDDGAESRYRRARARGMKGPRPAAALEARPDDRRDLVQEFWRLVVEAEADGFVLENVRSILHPRNRPIVDGLLVAATREGYDVRLVEADATHYGVAQRRQRVFVLGTRGARPEIPRRTHSDEPGSSRLAPVVTSREVLAPFRSKHFFEPEELVEGRWAKHLQEIPPGWNYKYHSAWAGHPTPTFEAETRFWNFLLKLDPGQPSWTIPASPGPWVGPFHWDGRRLRTPELAALQGFPTGYRFMGSRRERVRQIGNAVPAPMAQRMVEAVLCPVVGES